MCCIGCHFLWSTSRLFMLLSWAAWLITNVFCQKPWTTSHYISENAYLKHRELRYYNIQSNHKTWYKWKLTVSEWQLISKQNCPLLACDEDTQCKLKINMKARDPVTTLTVTWHLNGLSEEWTCLTWQLRWSGLKGEIYTYQFKAG